MSLENIAMIVGVLGSFTIAAVALYRARSQKDLDATIRVKANKEVEIAVEKHERDKTQQIIRLENYVMRDIQYHRDNNAYQTKLLETIEFLINKQGNGFTIELPRPPAPPELPDLPSDG